MTKTYTTTYNGLGWGFKVDFLIVEMIESGYRIIERIWEEVQWALIKGLDRWIFRKDLTFILEDRTSTIGLVPYWG